MLISWITIPSRTSAAFISWSNYVLLDIHAFAELPYWRIFIRPSHKKTQWWEGAKHKYKRCLFILNPRPTNSVDRPVVRREETERTDVVNIAGRARRENDNVKRYANLQRWSSLFLRQKKIVWILQSACPKIERKDGVPRSSPSVCDGQRGVQRRDIFFDHRVWLDWRTSRTNSFVLCDGKTSLSLDKTMIEYHQEIFFGHHWDRRTHWQRSIFSILSTILTLEQPIMTRNWSQFFAHFQALSDNSTNSFIVFGWRSKRIVFSWDSRTRSSISPLTHREELQCLFFLNKTKAKEKNWLSFQLNGNVWSLMTRKCSSHTKNKKGDAAVLVEEDMSNITWIWFDSIEFRFSVEVNGEVVVRLHFAGKLLSIDIEE